MEAEMLAIIGGIAVLLALSAYFSGSETALTAHSRPRMHLLEQQGDQRAGIVNRLYAQKEKLIGAILLGNNLVNILSSSLATSVLIAAFGDRGVFYATAGMTVLIVIFGEVMPKTYALQRADRVALAVAPTIGRVVAALSPIAHAINVIIRVSLRAFTGGCGPCVARAGWGSTGCHS